MTIEEAADGPVLTRLAAGPVLLSNQKERPPASNYLYLICVVSVLTLRDWRLESSTAIVSETLIGRTKSVPWFELHCRVDCLEVVSTKVWVNYY
jgi:hypothetical protein